MRILIIGGAGFLGSNLVRRCLMPDGGRPLVVDSLHPLLCSTVDHLQEVWENIQFVRGDIRDETLLAEVVQGQDVIFNLAAQTSHPLSIQFPILDADTNILGSLKLLEAVRLLSPKAVVVYVSTVTALGRPESETMGEAYGERPTEIYSASKGAAEKCYRIYHDLHGLRTVIIRFANLYGPYGKGRPEFSFINYFIHLASVGEDIKIFGAGNQLRNVLYAEDAVEVLWRAAQEPRLFGGTFHATSEEYLSVLEIAKRIIQTFQRGKIQHVEWPEERLRTELERVEFSSDRIRAITQWTPRYNIEAGLRRVKEILESQPK